MVGALQLRSAEYDAAATPVPLRLRLDELPVEELLVMISLPVAAPAVVGSNFTLNVAV